MFVEIGHFALALALGVAVVQTIVPLWGVARNDPALASVGPAAAIACFLLVAISFGCLMMSYVTSDFSVENVVANSHSTQPLIYKLTAVWGNHEGSMLLWVLILVLFGALVALSRRSLPPKLRAGTLAAQGSVSVAFLAFTLLTSNPFRRLVPAPGEGQDLNPILQDLGLAIHPPLLYVGYVGFSITYAFAVAALIEGKIDAVWARAVRPWTLLAWTFLTLGIAMGSYWAYYELGWGGWWFWDPVENASLMPWLAGTALIHSTVVMEKRDALKVWTILLAILTFSLSLLGTFIVRSGVLTSVHSFASDPQRGLFILGILIAFIGGSLALFAWRAPLLKQGGLFAPISRESALVVNNLFLATACATVFIGTLYPLVLEMITGDKISVGPPFFNATFVPLLVPLLLLLPIGQTLAWKRGDLLGAAQRAQVAFGAGVVTMLAIFAVVRGGPVLAPLGIGLGVFLVIGALWEIGERVVTRASGASAIWSRAKGLPRSAWGSALGHAGVGISVIGIAAAAWGTESIGMLKVGESLTSGRYTVTLEAITPRTGPNYREDAARFRIVANGRLLEPVEAMKRIYTARAMPTTEAGIRTVGLGQAYISLGEPDASGAIAVKLHDKPLILLIWIGALVMAAGGALSLTDRRFRLAAPRRTPAPAALPQAAE
ncbi:cytochrome C biogenesis protein CcmF [Bosea sp. Root483D1]|uniref:heme lyase CcmF/NrfE family subunit n=1 Tax=Bosea sp. Root483D1 TaxID=1736544 RepID=UPI00070D2DD5|nr:heme lyase CcmF/NrfE family subunit [Bosea sp. Root483D1]KRE17171.1 cytochrome C biogenesis protein CcmF [Bosea sp. Root483D1]